MPVSTQPYWQDSAVATALPRHALPARVDVLIVGGGYTGLSAARETAAAGAATLVLEAGSIGAGCSGRNGGQVAYSIKPSYAALKALYGGAKAYAICQEGRDAVTYLRWLATEQGIDCDWRERGCFFGAHTPRHFAAMVRDAQNQPRGLEQRISVVSKADQRREIDSAFYHGGCVYHDDASVDPMRLLLALLRHAQESGATILEHCKVDAIQRSGDGFEILTARGKVQARKVLIATNGYSGPVSSWLRRRVIPIGSYQIATEALGAERIRALIPQGRNIVDSRRVVVYFRPSPDGERLIFGGRAALSEKDPLACVPRLQAMMTRIFPQLKGVRTANAWVGWVAYTFDTLPHLGRHEGIHYCMGYCGQGVPLAPHFGRRIGQQMVGMTEGRTALDDLAFPSRPYYFGVPWFLAPSVFAFRALDAVGV
ncbi:MAG: NAD(P)/FAD-dependent oxidoreductase [Steroidobacteraceae bacterium]